jgi:hypothetical protein
VRWRGKRIVGHEDALARQAPVAHHQILHALSRPSPVTLRWDTLARKPFGYLAVAVADFLHGCLDVGRLGEGVVIGQIGDASRPATREGMRSNVG